MKKLFILDDNKYFRDSLVRHLKDLAPRIEVLALGDNIGDDFTFTEQFITEFRRKEVELYPVIDVQMTIDWQKWLRPGSRINKKNSHLVVLSPSAGYHGFNIMNAIQQKCEMAKIVTMSASVKEDLSMVIPVENQYYKHIVRDKADALIAREIVDFFDLTN